jgi:hypothetical protein
MAGMDSLDGPKPDARQRPGCHRVPRAVTFALATPGHAERSRQFTAEDLSQIVIALEYAAGGVKHQDRETEVYWRKLAGRLCGASATVRDGGEWPPLGGRCYSCGQKV